MNFNLNDIDLIGKQLFFDDNKLRQIIKDKSENENCREYDSYESSNS